MTPNTTALRAALKGDKVPERQTKSALGAAVNKIASLTRRAERSKEAMTETGSAVIHTAESTGSLFLASLAEGYFSAEKLKLGSLARPRLTELPDGRVSLELKTPWSDGTASLTFPAEELVERLAALVPQPGSHLVLYHGVLAGRHAWRSEVVPEPPQTVAQEDESALTRRRIPASSHYKTWAALLYPVFGIAGWRCPQCGGPMRLRAHAGGLSTERILEGLERSARGPPGGQVFVA